MIWHFVAIFAFFVLIAGFVVLWLLYRSYDGVVALYSTGWTKASLTATKAFSGAIAFATKSAGPGEEVLTVLTWSIAAASFFVWEVVDLMGASRAKGEELDRAFLQDQVALRIKLLRALSSLLHHKKQRICAELARRQQDRKIDRIGSARAGLSCRMHMLTVIQQLAEFLDSQLPSVVENHRQNFRVALYVEDEGVMRPVVAWNLAKKQTDFLKSHQVAPRHFHVDCIDRPSCVVRCVRERKLIIMTDCSVEMETFLHPGQKDYLLSLIAFPIFEFGGAPGDSKNAALVIDTDRAGYFKQEDEELIHVYLEQFANRLDLEATVNKLLLPYPGTTQEAANAKRRRGQGVDQGSGSPLSIRKAE